MYKLLILFTLITAFSIIFYSTNSKDLKIEKKLIVINSYDKDSIFKKGNSMNNKKVIKTDDEWKKLLTPEQYLVLRRKGTERAYSGEYWNHFESGIYCCAGCGAELFSSDSKFESHCGWPSYFIPLAEDRVYYLEDRSYGMIRTEVLCSSCDGHLGHVFDDGPEPTGLRYCINSISMKFIPKK